MRQRHLYGIFRELCPPPLAPGRAHDEAARLIEHQPSLQFGREVGSSQGGFHTLGRYGSHSTRLRHQPGSGHRSLGRQCVTAARHPTVRVPLPGLGQTASRRTPRHKRKRPITGRSGSYLASLISDQCRVISGGMKSRETGVGRSVDRRRSIIEIRPSERLRVRAVSDPPEQARR